jgi:hypothetical protein
MYIDKTLYLLQWRGEVAAASFASFAGIATDSEMRSSSN